MIWIDQQSPLDLALDRVAANRVVAVDTEADSLHSYFDKVCLIQISIPGEDFVVDPLRKLDLARFGDVLANRDITKILHGADYDLRILNRDFGFTPANLVDTMICAQLLGYEAIGLAALLERHFGLQLDKSHQRADWAQRPLPRDMLEYASTDTRHLVELAEKLRAELEALGRWEWALEEFARLETIRWTEREEEEPFRRLKGIGGLDRRSLAVVRALYDFRDRLARTADRPPFKIFGNDVILDAAKTKPQKDAELPKMKALTPGHRHRFGREIVRLVREAMALPEEQLPERGESKPWLRDKELDARINALKKVRDKYAAELKIDGSVVAPRHVLAAVAALRPKSVAELDSIPAMRTWQKRLLGNELVSSSK
ncbi:MAG TPA: HRDC domain-containing protein [Thermoanaerobaculia bacterium]|nr:HRDC domain-containing protein [Thermoanaerobaculia bacterium]